MPILMSPIWLPLPTLDSSSESRSRADSIIVVSWSSLSLDGDKGVTAVIGNAVLADITGDKMPVCLGSGAISSMSMAGILNDATGNSLVTRWLTLFVVLPRRKDQWYNVMKVKHD